MDTQQATATANPQQDLRSPVMHQKSLPQQHHFGPESGLTHTKSQVYVQEKPKSFLNPFNKSADSVIQAAQQAVASLHSADRQSNAVATQVVHQTVQVPPAASVSQQPVVKATQQSQPSSQPTQQAQQPEQQPPKPEDEEKLIPMLPEAPTGDTNLVALRYADRAGSLIEAQKYAPPPQVLVVDHPPFWQIQQNLPDLFLRISIAFAFGYHAVMTLVESTTYLQYFPESIFTLIPQYIVLYWWVAYQGILVLWLLSGKMRFFAGIVAASTVFLITLFNFSVTSILFQNAIIFFASLALAFKTRNETEAQTSFEPVYYDS